MKKIDEMSISELNAALDFVREDIKDTEEEVKIYLLKILNHWSY